MSCCNQCFEIALGIKDSRMAQGHHLCSAPTEGEVAAFVFGKRPSFHDSRWIAFEAIPAVIVDNEQVWILCGNYFVVRDGLAISVPQPEY